MKLDREQQRKILAGVYEPLAWRRLEDCPFEVGEEVVLKVRRGPDAKMKEGIELQLDPDYPAPDLVTSPLVWITITGIRRTKKGVVAEYRVRDDRPHFMARGGGSTTAPSFSIDADAEQLDERRKRESGVASSMRGEIQRVQVAKVRHERRLQDARATGKARIERAIVRQIGRLDERLDNAA